MQKIIKFIVCICILCFSLFVFLLLYAIANPIDLLNKQIIIYDVNNEIIYQSKQSLIVDIEDVDPFIIESLLAVEDQNFYTHLGFDPLRITKALYINITNTDIVQGASTITQQYAKNMYLSNEQTITRKLYEIVYSLQLEMHYSKDEILEGYLNSLYYGHNIYGFSNAALYYFNTNMNELSIDQIALLLGIPNGPSIYSPYINIENAYEKRNQILYIMLMNQLISDEEYQSAIQSEIVVDTNDYESSANTNYYIDAVLAELSEFYYSDDILKVYTYFDKSAQESLSNAISQQNTSDTLQTSGIIITPYTSNIIALQGGNDYTLSTYNRAIYSQRQIASTIKPLIYYLALCEGFTPSTTFTSADTIFTLDDNTTYHPENYNSVYPNKEISMIQAVATSDNIYAVKTLLYIGIDSLVDALSEFNITSESNPSLALGCVNTNILKLSEIYNTFASEGIYNEPSFISKIENEEKILYERELENIQLLDHDITLVLNQLLTAPFDNNANDTSFITMYANIPSFIAGAKSGTSNWDTWCVGFNPYYTIGIWNGYDDSQTIEEEFFETSKQIWKATFEDLMINKEQVWYSYTNNIEALKVNPTTGEFDNNGSVYWFLK